MGLFGFCHFPESFLAKCQENQLWLVPNVKLASSHVSAPPFPRAYVNSKLQNHCPLQVKGRRLPPCSRTRLWVRGRRKCLKASNSPKWIQCPSEILFSHTWFALMPSCRCIEDLNPHFQRPLSCTQPSTTWHRGFFMSRFLRSNPPEPPVCAWNQLVSPLGCSISRDMTGMVQQHAVPWTFALDSAPS